MHHCIQTALSDPIHVVGIQTPLSNKYSVSSSHLQNKKDWYISRQFSPSRQFCSKKCLAATISDKGIENVSVKFSSSSFYLEELVIAGQDSKESWEELQQGVTDKNFRASCVIRKLACFGHFEEANKIFRSLQQPDAYAWSAIISAYSTIGEYAQAVTFFKEMIDCNGVPDGHVFLAVIKACLGLSDLELGMHVHSASLKYGLDSDVYLSNALISMYAKVGNLEDACLIFNTLADVRDVVTWSTLIQAYSEHGYCSEAYEFLKQMQREGVQPNEFTLVCILKACSSVGDIEYGEQIHSLLIEHGFECNLFIGNTLMDMYVKCDSLEEAKVLINKLTKLDVVTWSIIMRGFAENGFSEETFGAFQKMQDNGVKPDYVTYACLAKAGESVEYLPKGRLIHSLIIGSGLELHDLVGESLVEMYIRCDSPGDAFAMFSRLPEYDTSVLNLVMNVLSQCGYSEKAHQVLVMMEKDGMKAKYLFSESFIRACSVSQDLERGMQLHCHLVKLGMHLNVRVGNALIEMYSECGAFGEACKLLESSTLDVVSWNIIIAQHARIGQDRKAVIYFEKMQSEGFVPNLVTWNSLIDAHYYLEDAFEIFLSMQKAGFAPNKITFVCILQKCCQNGCIEEGMNLHSHIIKTGLDVELAVQNTLIDMYAKNNSLETALLIFSKLRKRDEVSWNVLLSGHVMHGDAQKSFGLLASMQQDGVEPSETTYVSILQACSIIAAFEHGKIIHDQLIDNGFDLDLHVGNALIDFYIKCGAMEDAHVLLNRLPERDEVTWSTIILGHAKNCDYAHAYQCFTAMQRERLEPNGNVFLSILSACSHACRFDEGCLYFRSMQHDYGITPCADHFMVLAELLGKSGHLEEAEEVLEILPWYSNAVGWMTLLGLCKKHGSMELANRCFEYLMKLRSNSSSEFVLLSNCYTHAGLEDAVADVAGLRKKANVWKQPAKAYIEIDKQIHDFVVGDASHLRSEEIYSNLNHLLTDLKEQGYRPTLGSGQKSASVEEERCLWAHSEKLALSLGLLCTPEGATIRVAKNLRMCNDCHNVAKLISQKEHRDIIIKDSHCIHHFKDGDCCCLGL